MQMEINLDEMFLYVQSPDLQKTTKKPNPTQKQSLTTS